jgi:hypothetical protein
MGRGNRVLLALGVVLLLSLVDLAATLLALSGGGMFEGNPVVRWIVLATGSALVLILYKLATVAVGVGVLYLVRMARSAELASWAMAAVLGWLTVEWAGYFSVLEPGRAVTMPAGGSWIAWPERGEEGRGDGAIGLRERSFITSDPGRGSIAPRWRAGGLARRPAPSAGILVASSGR